MLMTLRERIVLDLGYVHTPIETIELVLRKAEEQGINLDVPPRHSWREGTLCY